MLQLPKSTKEFHSTGIFGAKFGDNREPICSLNMLREHVVLCKSFKIINEHDFDKKSSS